MNKQYIASIIIPLVLTVAFATACKTSAPSPSPGKSGGVKAKRKAPGEVPPVFLKGVKYVVPVLGQRDKNGRTHFLEARNVKSDALLWKVKVYYTDYRAGLETDVQDNFITKIYVKDGKIRVKNEEGRAFEIDPRTRSVEKLLEE